MTNDKQYSMNKAALAAPQFGLANVPQGGATVFPFYEAVVADRQQEWLREARRLQLARQAVAARRRQRPEHGLIRELRLAMGVALVRSGRAILPCEDGGAEHAA